MSGGDGSTAVPLFPDRFRRNMCELLPGQDRLTMSVFFQIDSQVTMILLYLPSVHCSVCVDV